MAVVGGLQTQLKAGRLMPNGCASVPGRSAAGEAGRCGAADVRGGFRVDAFEPFGNYGGEDHEDNELNNCQTRAAQRRFGPQRQWQTVPVPISE